MDDFAAPSKSHASETGPVANGHLYSVTDEKQRCQAATDAQREALRQAGLWSSQPYTCPLCRRVFKMKKSLVRHIKIVLQQQQGAGLKCDICGILCSRADVLARHQATQHAKGGKTVDCPDCRQKVRLRSLKSHQYSHRCKNAQTKSHDTASTPPEADESWEKFCAVSRSLHAQLDCVLLGAWVMLKLMPHGPGADEYWELRSRMSPTYEALKLQRLLAQAVRNATSLYTGGNETHLLDAVGILRACTSWINGWDVAQSQRQGMLFLAEHQIKQNKFSRDEFVSQDIAPAFLDISHKVFPEEEWGKCLTLIQLVLRLVRASAYDTIWRLSDANTKPLSEPEVKVRMGMLTSAVWVAHYRERFDGIAEVAASIEPERRQRD